MTWPLAIGEPSPFTIGLMGLESAFSLFWLIGPIYNIKQLFG